MRELDFITLIMCSQDATYKHPQKDSTQIPKALQQLLAKPSLHCLSFSLVLHSATSDILH